MSLLFSYTFIKRAFVEDRRRCSREKGSEMNIMNVASACAVAVLSAGASAGLSNFIVADADGGVYTVNGRTLEATQVAQMDSSYSINEILYLGNNELLVNVTGQFIQYNIGTGAEEVVFNARDYLGDVGYHYTTGLAQMDSGDIFFSVKSYLPSETTLIGASFNLNSHSFTEMNDIEFVNGLYFDHHQVGENLYAGARFGQQQITIINTLTGQNEAAYDVGFGVVSFFESHGSLFTMSKGGEIHSFDASDGSTSLVGRITGAGPGLIGASIPAPSSLTLLSFAGLAGTRRRR